jgi:hypothetical protein
MTVQLNRIDRSGTIVPNEIINNPNLSWAAIGLLAFIFSRPKDTIVTKQEMLLACTNSEEEIDLLLLELKREVGL